MNPIRLLKAAAAIATVVAATTFATSAFASPFFFLDQIFQAPQMQAPAEQAMPSIDEPSEAPARFPRPLADIRTHEAPAPITIDPPKPTLPLVLGSGKAIRCGIGVGGEGSTWSGTQAISRKAEWPDWTPPAEMIARQPYLPRHVAGGPGNPLGARAMYLGN